MRTYSVEIIYTVEVEAKDTDDATDKAEDAWAKAVDDIDEQEWAFGEVRRVGLRAQDAPDPEPDDGQVLIAGVLYDTETLQEVP